MNKTIYTIFLVLVIAFVSMSIVKAWYWPAVSYDAIAGYDLYGKLIAEGVNPYKLEYIQEGVGNRGKIPPLIPVGLALFKTIGLNSQLLMSVLLVVTCLLLYFNIKNKIYAIIAVFLVVVTPEFIAFSSIVNTNTAVALFVLGGVIYLNKNTWLSIIFFSLAVLSRSDAVIFVLFAYPFQERHKDARLLLALVPFIMWQAYILGGTSVFGFPSYANFEILWHGILNQFMGLQMFGITFLAFPAVLLFRHHNPEQLRLAYLIIAFIMGNALLYLCLDPEIMGASYQHIINASFKRSLFTFVPLIWYYVWRIE